MPTVFARGGRLYAKIKDANGTWQQIRTGFRVGDERKAERWATDRAREVAQFVAARGDHSELTVTAYATTWLNRRTTKTVRDDRTRIERHVLPVIGDMLLVDVRPRHMRDLVMELRAGTLAPKTIRQISGVMHTMFKSAYIDELVTANPVTYERGVLPKQLDRDPTWRAQAIFTRQEIERILSDRRLPLNRRVLYALKFFAGRHSEIACLTWSAYDPTTKPLGTLHLGRTKTGVPRAVPVHPVLASLLAAHRGKAKPGDLIAPTRFGQQRKAAESQKQFRRDLARIGLRTQAGVDRNRRGHDLRRTFITLARADGAIDSLLRWVTHGPKPSEILDVYSTPPWAAQCKEIRKLRLRAP